MATAYLSSDETTWMRPEPFCARDDASYAARSLSTDVRLGSSSSDLNNTTQLQQTSEYNSHQQCATVVGISNSIIAVKENQQLNRNNQHPSMW